MTEVGDKRSGGRGAEGKWLMAYGKNGFTSEVRGHRKERLSNNV